MMKRKICHIVFAALFLAGISVSMASAVTPGTTVTAQGTGAVEEQIAAAYLQDIAFEKLPGKERVILTFSRESGAMIESKNSQSVVAIMANTYIPEDLRQALGEGKLDNLYRISASQKDKDGQPWGYVTMDLRERVPYMVRKEGPKILIDFNVTGLAGKAGYRPAASARLRNSATSANRAATAAMPKTNRSAEDPLLDRSRLITIDFQEANIKSVLRLLAEEGGVSIASGDDVRGNVTLTLRKVSWQEAFETVLAVQGLGKVKEGDVFIVKTIDRMRKEEKTKADEAIDRIKRQNAQEIADQEKRVKDGRLPQISIEAKIVEVSRSGSRELGVLWGGAWKGSEIGFVGSNSAPVEGNTSTFALRSPMWDNAGVAVNVPSTSSALNPTLGVVVATSNLLLSAKLEALETSGEGKIISSPRVTTLDNEQAKIGQGEEIPYVTRDEDGVQKVEMKDAKLELEVTPKITSEGKISLKVIATNKAADWEKVNKNNENPPLVASNVESKVVISDGDTLVVGGIRKQNVTKSTTAVPWLSKIPVLGWLFKSESNVTQERELLIFVTPRIVKGV